MLYVDSLDVSGLDIDLSEGRYVVTIWSRELIDEVLIDDLQNDGNAYGKLEVCNIFYSICVFMLLITFYV